MDLIKEVDPFYRNPIDEEEYQLIYSHQQPSIKAIIDIENLVLNCEKEFDKEKETLDQDTIEIVSKYLNKIVNKVKNHHYPICAFVGQTGRGVIRFSDRDYSHLPEEVRTDFILKVHPDLSDHYIRASLYSCGCRKSTLGGSPEVVLAPLYIKTYSEFISFLHQHIITLSNKFYEQERVYGFTPESLSKKIKEKNPEAVRAPKLHLVYEIVEKLKNLAKDAMIYVPMDAFGHFCITLANVGYTNIYTDKGYDMSVGLGHIPECVKYITQEEYNDMNFDAVIGNPPYGKGGKLALRFLNNALERVRKKNGQIILVLPKSVKQGSANYNKINLDLELVWSKDCADNDFAASIDACIQEWKIGEKQRELDPEHKQHPHIEFLKYEHRYDADIFVGGDGGGASGKVFLPGEKNKDGKQWTDYEKSSSHNYIRVRPDDNNSKEEILKRIIALGQNGDNTFRKVSIETTNGIPHLGKTKLITIYTKRYGNGHGQESAQ